MSKGRYQNVSIRKELISKVKEIIEDHGYASISSFIHESIRVRLQEMDGRGFEREPAASTVQKTPITVQQPVREPILDNQMMATNTDITRKVLELLSQDNDRLRVSLQETNEQMTKMQRDLQELMKEYKNLIEQVVEKKIQ